MPIEFHCSHCNKQIRAPRDAGGRRGKCPYCKQSVYIPTHPDDTEEIGLAPLDQGEEAQRRQMTEESLRVQAELAHESREPPETGKPVPIEGGLGVPPPPSLSGKAVNVDKAVVRYVNAMRASRLEEAEQVCALLKTDAGRAREHIQRLMVDEIPPAGTETIPPALFKGFLKTLLDRL